MAQSWDVEEAWRELRRRLAEAVLGLEESGRLVIEAQAGVLEDGPGVYVQVVDRDGELLRVEAVSDEHLDTAHRVGARGAERLAGLGWLAPNLRPDEADDEVVDDESAHWWLDADPRDPVSAEHVAWLLVATLRTVFGVHHPAFLACDELDLTGLRGTAPDLPWPVAALPVVSPEDPQHLQRLVDEAARSVLGEEARHDADGDLPFACGEKSAVFVRVDPDRPVVELFSVLVCDITRPEALPEALQLLGDRLPWVSVRVVEDRLVLTHELCAMPFVPQHLARWVHRAQVELDPVAEVLARRLGGRRFAEDERTGNAPVPPAPVDEQLAVVAELLVADDLPPRLVAEVFEHDRGAIVRRLVAVRRGEVDPAPAQVEDLLDVLRQGLRFVVDERERVEDRMRRARRRVLRRPTVQPALVEEEADLFGDLVDDGKPGSGFGSRTA